MQDQLHAELRATLETPFFPVLRFHCTLVNSQQYTRTIYFSARCPNFPPFPDTADRYAARSIRAMAIKMGEGEKRGQRKQGKINNEDESRNENRSVDDGVHRFFMPPRKILNPGKRELPRRADKLND